MTKNTSTYKNYPKPPIVEAMIDIQFQPSQIFSIGILEKLYKEMQKEYPNKEEIRSKTAEVNILEEKANFINEQIGLKLSSSDKKYIVQFQKRGFTFSILDNYHGWEDLLERGQELWELFCNKTKPDKVIRLAVRYINKINIPKSNFKLEEYFNIYPNVFNKQLSGFFLQVQIPQIKEGGLAIVHQTITKPLQTGYTSILLDLDLFEFKQMNPDSPEIWKRMNIFRKQKDDLFESCITSKTRELFL